MKERPILFNADMVRVILEGRKTQTRRVVKGQPYLLGQPIPDYAGGMGFGTFDGVSGVERDGEFWIESRTAGAGIGRCPYGIPGDKLWVRERMWLSNCGRYFARRATPTPENNMPLYDVLARDGSAIWHYGRGINHDLKMAATSWSNHGRYIGRGEKKRWREGFEIGFIDDFDHTKTAKHPYGRSIERKTAEFHRRWPSIHMPRWASRITLEIVSVRVERLDEISEEDAKAEGVTPAAPLYGDCGGWKHELHKESFTKLWDSIHGAGSCEANPWVWVVEFKRVTP